MSLCSISFSFFFYERSVDYHGQENNGPTCAIKSYICTNMFYHKLQIFVKTALINKVIMFEKTLKFNHIIIIYYGRHKIYGFTTKST
jgi:hypothetical protein